MAFILTLDSKVELLNSLERHVRIIFEHSTRSVCTVCLQCVQRRRIVQIRPRSVFSFRSWYPYHRQVRTRSAAPPCWTVGTNRTVLYGGSFGSWMKRLGALSGVQFACSVCVRLLDVIYESDAHSALRHALRVALRLNESHTTRAALQETLRRVCRRSFSLSNPRLCFELFTVSKLRPANFASECQAHFGVALIKKLE